MDNLLLAFSDVQIRPKVGFAPAAVIRDSEVMEELSHWPTGARSSAGYPVFYITGPSTTLRQPVSVNRPELPLNLPATAHPASAVSAPGRHGMPWRKIATSRQL